MVHGMPIWPCSVSRVTTCTRGAGEVLRPAAGCLACCGGSRNVDISRARRHSQRNIAKLAAYLSKYLSKTFDAGGVGDSYRASGKALPKPVVVRSLATDLGGAGSDLLGLLFKFYSVRTLHSAYLDCGGVYVAITP